MARKLSKPLRVAYATVKGLHEIGLVDDATFRGFTIPLPDRLLVGIDEHQELQKRAILRRRNSRKR